MVLLPVLKKERGKKLRTQTHTYIQYIFTISHLLIMVGERNETVTETAKLTYSNGSFWKPIKFSY